MKRSKLKEKFDLLRYKFEYILKFNVWFIHGTEVQNGHRLAIIFGGDEQTRNFIIDLAFGDGCEVITLGKRGLYDIILNSKGIKQDCCMVILKINDTLCKFIKRNRDFYIPLWVHGEIDIPISLLKRSVKSDLKKINREKLTFEVTTEESKVSKFYYTMYLPYVKQRHGNRVILTKYTIMEQYLKAGACDLILVKSKSESIAGVLILYQQNEPRLWLLGIKDSDQYYRKDHASAACYYFASTYLNEQGYRNVSLGGSRAFLNNGVLQFKKKRGLKVIDKSEGGFLIKPLFASKGLRGFFLRNPFIYLDRGELCGAIFVDNDEDCSSESVAKLCKCFWVEGLSSLKIYRFMDDASANDMTISSEIFNKMTMRVADQPVKSAY